jgi:hypothetical protein
LSASKRTTERSFDSLSTRNKYAATKTIVIEISLTPNAVVRDCPVGVVTPVVYSSVRLSELAAQKPTSAGGVRRSSACGGGFSQLAKVDALMPVNANRRNSPHIV